MTCCYDAIARAGFFRPAAVDDLIEWCAAVASAAPALPFFFLKRNRFDGVLIPDHTPQMTCAAPWHAGMAYAMGWMRAALQRLD